MLPETNFLFLFFLSSFFLNSFIDVLFICHKFTCFMCIFNFRRFHAHYIILKVHTINVIFSIFRVVQPLGQFNFQIFPSSKKETSCSSAVCPHSYSQLQAITSILFVSIDFFLGTSLLSGTMECSRLMLQFLCP